MQGHVLFILMKKNILLTLFVVASICTHAHNLKQLLKKNHLPGDVTILSVMNEDCLNCYYGFSFFLKNKKADIQEGKLVFLLEERSRPDLEAFFTYRLGLDSKNCKIILDDNLFQLLNLHGATTLNVINNYSLQEQYTSSTLYKYTDSKSNTLTLQAGASDTINLGAWFGTTKLSVQVLDTSSVVVHQRFTNTLFEFDIQQKKILRELPFSFFTNRYDSLLRIALKDDPENLSYNLAHYKTADFYQSFPLAKIKTIKTVNGFLFVGLSLSHMVPGENGHITYEGIQCLLKLDRSFRLLDFIALPNKLDEVKGRYLSLLDMSFPNADTVALPLSGDGGRKKDSVLVLYSLPQHKVVRFPSMGFEPFMPLKGANGYYNYFHFGVFSMQDSAYGFFTQSPYVYNLASGSKKLLPGPLPDPASIQLDGKDANFWICAMGAFKNRPCMVYVDNNAKTYLLEYDSGYSKMLNKLFLMDGFLDQAVFTNDQLIGIENYQKTADVCVLHKFRLH